MNISAKEVNKLRKMTGAGMMDCKKALVETGGDFDAAIENLRKKGQKVAAKRADRDATEGAVIALTNDAKDTGVVVKVSCETDFVAKNNDFVGFARSIAELALTNLPTTKEDLLALDLNGKSVADNIEEQIGKIGEKIEVAHYEKVQSENVSAYIHAGNKIGVLVSYKDGGKDGADAFFRGVAMHIAAMKPIILSYTEFEPDFIAKETEAFISQIKKENEERTRLGKHLKNVPQFVSKYQLTDEAMATVEQEIKDQLAAEGKPEKIWDKIVPGKLERFVADNTLLDQEYCLLDQFFALDGSKTVGAAVSDFADGAEIIGFKRIALG